MANSSHIEILLKGTDIWNAWRDENPDTIPDLSGAKLRGINLCDANLNSANLCESILPGASLINTSLENALINDAHLDGAILTEANLMEAELKRTDLGSVKFNDADLSSSDLSHSNLKDADFSGSILFDTDLRDTNLESCIFIETYLFMTKFYNAKVAFTIFGDVDLSMAIGLETIVHDAPSTIGIDAIYRSQGNIPEKFLKEAGIPLDFISNLPSIFKNKKDYYSCFLSYSSKDQIFASKLFKSLKKAGVRVWFAPHDMKIGQKIRQTIDKSIKYHDKLLLVLSKDSIGSQWVEKEVETAFEEERNRKKTVLFPIRLDSFVMGTNEAWASDIRRTRHIGDFSTWKEETEYQESFNNLIKSLKETNDKT